MTKLVKTIFGGTDSSAQDAQMAANTDSQEFIKQMMNRGRNDALTFAPASDANRNMGFQSALDVYGQSMPQQVDTFQQGNMGAQAQLLAGLPQFQNAIMGAPVNYNAFQPQQIQYDPSFMQQQLPQFISTASLLGGLDQGQPAAPAANNYPPRGGRG